MIGTIIAGGAALTAGAVYLKKKYTRAQYFKSKEYKESAGIAQELAERSATLLSRKSVLTYSEKENFKKLSAGPMRFFAEKPYELSEELERSLSVVGEFEGQSEAHDKEAYINVYLNARIDRLLRENRYVPYSEWNAIFEEFCGRVDVVRKFEKFMLPDTRETLTRYERLKNEVDVHNEKFIAAELVRCSRFFDGCAYYKLDEQQRRACVIDDNAGLVIAGAGSGKTSTIVAKVKYLVKQRGVDPSEILLISYTRKAAEEMSDRINRAIHGANFGATTFHALGLGLVKSRDGSVVPCDERLLRETIHRSLTGRSDFTDSDYENLVRFVAYLAAPSILESEFSSYGDYLDHQKMCGLMTMKGTVKLSNTVVSFGGERVKSQEEVLIANYLFVHGIRYEYEREFPGGLELEDGTVFRYRPDFYLPDYEVYIEHFALDENNKAPAIFGREAVRYENSYRNKMQFHRRRGTKLVDSYSWWNRRNCLLEKIGEKLRSLGVPICVPDWKTVWQHICNVNANQLSSYEKLSEKFITLFREGNWGRDRLDALTKGETRASVLGAARLGVFVSNVKPLMDAYEAELSRRNEVDFSDMINRAAAQVASSRKRLKYRYVIVDEFQDVSQSRVELLRAIIGNTGAHLFCVGDDWQSIYRFSGSDVNLFLNFADSFGPYVEMKIENTYRNSQELIDVMGRFVMRNKLQVKKRLTSSVHEKAPIAFVLYPKEKCRAEGMQMALKNALDQISLEARGEDRTVMLLGRTKYDEPSIVKNNQCKLVRKGREGFSSALYPNLKMRFLTIHKAKGLEDDYVVLLNLESGEMGFPNQIEDDPILQCLLARPEPTPFAEERRLFYVAITRAKRKAFLVVPEVRFSKFVDELMKLGVTTKVATDGCSCARYAERCPRCKTGFLVERRSSRDGGIFYGCSHYPQCSFTRSFVDDEPQPIDLPQDRSCSGVGVVAKDAVSVEETVWARQVTSDRIASFKERVRSKGHMSSARTADEIEVRGLLRYGYDEASYERVSGRKVSFEREPTNPHDRNAIRVMTPLGRVMGYVNRQDAVKLATRIDNGIVFEVRLIKGSFRDSWCGSCRVSIMALPR